VVRPLRGGLAVATVIVGAIVGAVSGVVAAGSSALGLIALPPEWNIISTTAASIMGSVLVAGTLGQLIPPSLVMVIYGAVTNLSVGKLFAAGVKLGNLAHDPFLCIHFNSGLDQSGLSPQHCLPISGRPGVRNLPP